MSDGSTADVPEIPDTSDNEASTPISCTPVVAGDGATTLTCPTGTVCCRVEFGHTPLDPSGVAHPPVVVDDCLPASDGGECPGGVSPVP
jgi:hypothetical protein